MTKKEQILEYFEDINVAYNNSTMHDTLEHMLEDLEEVRHGHWENYLTEGLRWKCSECGSRFETPYHYCPHCGAKMDERKEDETD